MTIIRYWTIIASYYLCYNLLDVISICNSMGSSEIWDKYHERAVLEMGQISRGVSNITRVVCIYPKFSLLYPCYSMLIPYSLTFVGVSMYKMYKLCY